MPGKGWFTILRLYSPLESFFTKEWRCERNRTGEIDTDSLVNHAGRISRSGPRIQQVTTPRNLLKSITMKTNMITALLTLATAFAMPAMAQVAEDVTPEEARAIAKEAAIYGFPVIDSYRINYDYFFKPGTPEYKGQPNTLINVPRVYTPADTAIRRPTRTRLIPVWVRISELSQSC